MLRIIFILLFFCDVANAGELKPFKSDGCSSFPDGHVEQKKLWLDCCVEHDRAYWKGGSSDERENTGQSEIAQLMLAGVRVGGTPYLPTSFRWGYGWPYPRGYKKLTEAEIQEIKAQLENQEQKDQ